MFQPKVTGSGLADSSAAHSHPGSQSDSTSPIFNVQLPRLLDSSHPEEGREQSRARDFTEANEVEVAHIASSHVPWMRAQLENLIYSTGGQEMGARIVVDS